MARLAIPTIGLVVCLLSGCGSDATKVVPVSGVVTLDGKPMPEGEIAFAVTGKPSLMFPIQDGKFSGEVEAGSHRVEIRAYKNGPPQMMGGQPVKDSGKTNYIPIRFNNQSTLKADIKEEGANELKYAISSR